MRFYTQKQRQIAVKWVFLKTGELVLDFVDFAVENSFLADFHADVGAVFCFCDVFSVDLHFGYFLEKEVAFCKQINLITVFEWGCEFNDGYIKFIQEVSDCSCFFEF